MKINRKGCTRIVIEFKTTVWKIPRLNYSWEHFLKGLLHNIQERNTWKWNSGKYETSSYLLCPVLFSLPGGWLVIMLKADMKKHEDEIRALPNSEIAEYPDQCAIRYKEFIKAGFGGDDNPNNYGYLNNKLVKVDYGS